MDVKEFFFIAAKAVPYREVAIELAYISGFNFIGSRCRIKQAHKIRVQILPSGRYSVMDVTEDSPLIEVGELHPKLQDALSLMLLLDLDSEVEDLGYRYNEHTFYINADHVGPIWLNPKNIKDGSSS